MRKKRFMLKMILAGAFLAFLSFPSLQASAYTGGKSAYEEADAARKRYRYLKHKVRPGESVSSILKVYNISLDVVLEDNAALRDPAYVLAPGEVVLIRKGRLGEVSDREIDLQVKRRYCPEETAVPADYVAPREYTKTDLRKAEMIEHTVLPKETLYSLSKQYHVSVPDILRQNPAVEAEGLKAGAVLLIPVLKEHMPPKEGGIVDFDLPETLKFQESADPEGMVRVAFLLPLSQVSEAEQAGFLALYKGALVAMDSLKRDGLSVHVDLFDTRKDAATVGQLCERGALSSADVIIGPVYDEPFTVAAEYAQRQGIPIVSPLLCVTADRPVVVQMPPVKESHYDKLAGAVRGRKIVYFLSENDDLDFLAKVDRAAADNVKDTLVFDKNMKVDGMTDCLNPQGETLFVIANREGVYAEMLYSKISALAQGYPHKKISVLGTSAFGKFEDLKKSELFKVDTRYIASYHSDRLNPKVYAFDKRYIDFFNEKPSMMSYRGYDVAMIVLSAVGGYGKEALSQLEERTFTPLQVGYSLFRADNGGKLVNDEWPMVNYKTNYTIEVK